MSLFKPETKLEQTSGRLVYPVIPIRDKVIFPGALDALTLGRKRSRLAVEEATKQARNKESPLVLFITQKRPDSAEPKPEDLYKVGTLSAVRRFWKVNDDYNLTVEGQTRVHLREFLQLDPFIVAEVEEIPEISEQSQEVEALVRNITAQMKRYGEIGGSLSLEASISIFSADDPNRLVDAIASGINFKVSVKQQLLEMIDTKERLKKISEILAREIQVLEIGRKISRDTQKRVGQTTREAILREQLKSIQRELGETDEEGEIQRLKRRIAKAKMPKEVKDKAEKELRRLSKMSPLNPEASYIRTFLEWLVEMPWQKKSRQKIDIQKAQTVLDEDHYGLEKTKERILEYLAVQKIAGKLKGPILCFVGPPGTGKTSLGKSIARALGRKFVRISLGGVRDEAEIRGHRRTYVGAMPGRIIQGVKQAGEKNPVFMLDEIDKVGSDFRGDPSAALLEALDPEQNDQFSDHYLEVPFDLSDVMFITTANILDTVPPALRDRMEVIKFPGYTLEEKYHIGADFLFPKQLKRHGLKKNQIKISHQAFREIIREYTREAGVRNLERELAKICRKVARRIAEGEAGQVKIGTGDLSKYLGPAKYLPEMAEKQDDVGLATGLAVTEAGGEILTIEVGLMPGKGKLSLTGHLGEVMKESCAAALSYVRAHASDWAINKNFYKNIDVHVHVPAGAVPKDGPSAGVAIVTALVSALTKIKVRKDVAMTGEITLRGRVLEIGGVKAKVLAAHRAGIKTVVLPETNKKDLVEVPENVRNGMKFVYAGKIETVLETALTRKPRSKKRASSSPKRPKS
jgi:ATP-dependent Lon protease